MHYVVQNVTYMSISLFIFIQAFIFIHQAQWWQKDEKWSL